MAEQGDGVILTPKPQAISKKQIVITVIQTLQGELIEFKSEFSNTAETIGVMEITKNVMIMGSKK